MSEVLQRLDYALRKHGRIIGRGTFSCVFAKESCAYKWQPLYDNCSKHGEFLRQIKELCFHQWLSKRSNYVIPVLDLETKEIEKIWASCLQMPLCGELSPRKKLVNCTLYEYTRGNYLSLSLCAEISRDLLRGIHFLHQSGISHMDLNPRNILVRFDEKGKPIIFLSDFGLAEAVYDDEEFTDRNLLKVALWWRQHKESYIKDDMSDGFSNDLDIFSWAIITFELLCNSSRSESYVSLWNRNWDYLPPYPCYQHVIKGMRRIASNITKNGSEEEKKLLQICGICFTPEVKLPSSKWLLETYTPFFTELCANNSFRAEKDHEAKEEKSDQYVVSVYARARSILSELKSQKILLFNTVEENDDKPFAISSNAQVYKALLFYVQLDMELGNQMSSKWKWILTYSIALPGDFNGEYLIESQYTDFLLSRAVASDAAKAIVLRESELKQFYEEIPKMTSVFSSCKLPIWGKLSNEQRAEFICLFNMSPGRPKKKRKCAIV